MQGAGGGGGRGGGGGGGGPSLTHNGGGGGGSTVTYKPTTNTGKIDAAQHHQHQQQPPNFTTPPPLSSVQLTNKMKVVLLKCFGPVSESVINQNNLIVSSLLQDVYRQSYFTTSNSSDLPLSPESCLLLTICYLSSLKRGERISVESLRTMMHYAQLGELDWLHYYKKHKKMSESTFVQAQLIHLSRVAVYPVMGKVRVVISSQSLNEGVAIAVQKMVQLVNLAEQNCPEYWVVLTVRPSSTIDFCVLVMDPLQIQLLCELKALNSDLKTRRLHVKSQIDGHIPVLRPDVKPSSSGSKLVISKDLLLSVQYIQQKLGSGVLVPFLKPDIMFDPDSEHVIAGMSFLKINPVMVDRFVPSFSHLVEHKPKGPFQDQYNVAMHMFQKILSYWGNRTKIEEYRRIDFRVLVPPDATLVSQTVSEIIESGLVQYLKLLLRGEGDEGTPPTPPARGGSRETGKDTHDEARGLKDEVEKRVICCGSSKDSPRFRALLNELERTPDTLYIIVIENSHMTSSVVNPPSPSSSSSNSPSTTSDDIRLLCALPNCVLINVSSHPYSLQTNRSFVLFSNEIHWPISSDKSGLHFCSANEFKSNQFQNLKNEFEYGVRFRDDQCYEEMFHEAITNVLPK